jgi:hypothetical protein
MMGAAKNHRLDEVKVALKDRATPQDIHFGYRRSDGLAYHPEPLSIQHAS